MRSHLSTVYLTSVQQKSYSEAFYLCLNKRWDILPALSSSSLRVPGFMLGPWCNILGAEFWAGKK